MTTVLEVLFSENLVWFDEEDGWLWFEDDNATAHPLGTLEGTKEEAWNEYERDQKLYALRDQEEWHNDTLFQKAYPKTWGWRMRYLWETYMETSS